MFQRTIIWPVTIKYQLIFIFKQKDPTDVSIVDFTSSKFLFTFSKTSIINFFLCSSICSLPFSILFLPFFCTTPPLPFPFILYGFYPPGQITYFILYLLCNFSLPCMISVLKFAILFTVIYTVPPFVSSFLWDNFFLYVSFSYGFPYFNQFSIVRTLFICPFSSSQILLYLRFCLLLFIHYFTDITPHIVNVCPYISLPLTRLFFTFNLDSLCKCNLTFLFYFILLIYYLIINRLKVSILLNIIY